MGRALASDQGFPECPSRSIGTFSAMTSEDRSSLELHTISLRSGVHLLTVRGELDCAGADELREALDRLAEGDVVVDVADLRIEDWSGLAPIARAARPIRASGRELTVVCKDNPTIADFLRSAGVSIADDQEKALRYVFGGRLLRRVREHAMLAARALDST